MSAFNARHPHPWAVTAHDATAFDLAARLLDGSAVQVPADLFSAVVVAVRLEGFEIETQGGAFVLTVNEEPESLS